MEIDTPALCLDLDRFERNVAQMVRFCQQHETAWRPHAKCHRSPAIAQRLVDAGAIGVTCATLSEAEAMAREGIEDILLANHVAGNRKIERLVTLSRECRLICCIDDLEQAQAIAAQMQKAQSQVRVLVELEIGMQRVGAASPNAALELAGQVQALDGLELTGVMAYEGHLLTIADATEKVAAIRAAVGNAIHCRDLMRSAGLPCPIVSCGGTGSYPITTPMAGVTEVQAGGAIFMDMFYREACQITELEHALSVRATVVSRPASDRVVIDAGRKALDTAIHPPKVVSHEGVHVNWLSAEHGILRVDPGANAPQLGEIVEIIPGYADLTNNLYSEFHAFRGEDLEDVFRMEC